MENTLKIDLLALIATAVERREHGCETDLTSFAAQDLATVPSLRLWCSRSRDGKSRGLRSLPNVKDSYVAARSYDLAFGLRDEEPTTLVQLKYDTGMGQRGANHTGTYCTNQPFQHALGDLIAMGSDFQRLEGKVECFVVSVVHCDNLDKAHRWKPFLDNAEWTFGCEPSAIEKTGSPRKGFVDRGRHLVQPYTAGQTNQVFGTPGHALGYGLFARPGVLTVRFRTRSTMVEDFAVIEWRFIDVSLDGADLPLNAWLP